MTRFLLAVLLGYLIGSIPISFFLVKWRKKLDIRREGSGNIGTMNVFEVTNSRTLGILVLVIDVLKPVVVVLLARAIFAGSPSADGDFWIMGSAGIGATLGHIFSPWMGFRGGRGLATTLGVSLVLAWMIAVAWIGAFAVVFLIRRDIHVANIVASLLMPVILMFIPAEVITATSSGAHTVDVIRLSIWMMLLILLGHFRVLVQFLDSRTNNPAFRKR